MGFRENMDRAYNPQDDLLHVVVNLGFCQN